MSETSYVYKEKQAAAGAPLFFVFHCTGGDENQFFSLASELMPEAHVIAARGDVSEHGALRYFRRKAEGVYDMADLAERSTKLAGFIAAHKARLAAKHIIGLGYSNGANILASVLMEKPGLFSEAILMHPLIPWQPKPVQGLQALRLLMTAGRHDPICPEALTQGLADWFKAQGTVAELLWHDGGHELRQTELAAAQKFLAA